MTKAIEKSSLSEAVEPISPTQKPVLPDMALLVPTDAQYAAMSAMMAREYSRFKAHATKEVILNAGPDGGREQGFCEPASPDLVMVAVGTSALSDSQQQNSAPDQEPCTNASLGEEPLAGTPADLGLVEATVPWHDPVDGQSLADEICARLESYVVFRSRHFAVLVTLWIIGTYCMSIWRLWPKLFITAAVWGSGKSTLLEVVHAYVFRGTTLSNCTAATVFRILSQVSPTLCLDEADTWLKGPDLHGILNASHVRTQARVARVGPNGGIEVFNIWSPIAISGIGTQRNTLVSRSLVIPLHRKLRTDDLEWIGFDIHAETGDTRRQLLRWASDNLIAIKAATSVPPDCGDPRRRDNFRPLYQLAAVLGGPWPQLLETAYLETTDMDDGADEVPGLLLLRDIWGMFMQHPTETAIRTAEIIQYLSALEESRWTSAPGSRAISPHQMAQFLRPFGVKSHDKRDGDRVAKCYMRQDVKLAYDRYAAPARVKP